MSIIQEYEDFIYDWDWYAVDEDGHVGHFTNGGLRQLPGKVRRNRDLVKSLEHYFFDQAPVIGSSSVVPGAEKYAKWTNAEQRDRHMKFFTEMAIRGLFSYDTEIDRSPSAGYYLLVTPHPPLMIDALPDSIRNDVAQVRAPFCFDRTPYISESETLGW
jgi:hypothetical protein